MAGRDFRFHGYCHHICVKSTPTNVFHPRKTLKSIVSVVFSKFNTENVQKCSFFATVISPPQHPTLIFWFWKRQRRIFTAQLAVLCINSKQYWMSHICAKFIEYVNLFLCFGLNMGTCIIFYSSLCRLFPRCIAVFSVPAFIFHTPYETCFCGWNMPQSWRRVVLHSLFVYFFNALFAVLFCEPRCRTSSFNVPSVSSAVGTQAHWRRTWKSIKSRSRSQVRWWSG